MSNENLSKNSLQEFIIPIVVATVLFMEFMDITIINTAIPSIAKDFLINPILLKFSVASYYLSLAIFIPISGWCTDKFGTKSIFLFSVSLFIAASFFCGISNNTSQLTICRFLQGTGGAFMVPVARIILLRSFPKKDLVRIQSITYTPALAGHAVGPFVGGIITDHLTWHWIFYINIPIGITVIYLGSKFIKQHIADELKKFDIFGFILVGFALFSITFFVEMLNHYEIVPYKLVIFSGIAGVILLLGLIIHCLTKKDAIFDFSLFKIKTLRVGFIVYFATSAIGASIGFILPLIFQKCFLFTASQSGLLILPIAFGIVLARSIASRIIRKLGFKSCILVHLILFMVAILLLAQINQNTAITYILCCEFIFGVAMVIINSSVGALNYVDIPTNKISAAISMDITSRQFSSSMGIGLSAFILTSLIKYFGMDIYAPTATAFHYTFYFMVALVLIAIYGTTKLTKDSGMHILS